MLFLSTLHDSEFKWKKRTHLFCLFFCLFICGRIGRWGIISFISFIHYHYCLLSINSRTHFSFICLFIYIYNLFIDIIFIFIFLFSFFLFKPIYLLTNLFIYLILSRYYKSTWKYIHTFPTEETQGKNRLLIRVWRRCAEIDGKYSR